MCEDAAERLDGRKLRALPHDGPRGSRDRPEERRPEKKARIEGRRRRGSSRLPVPRRMLEELEETA
jgi:hypothetical protein